MAFRVRRLLRSSPRRRECHSTETMAEGEKQVNDESKETARNVIAEYRAYREGHADGLYSGVSWGYVIGLAVGGLIVWALMKEGVTWMR